MRSQVYWRSCWFSESDREEGSLIYKKLFWGTIIVTIIIAVLWDQFNWLADFLIDPGSKIPDPGEIDLPGVK